MKSALLTSFLLLIMTSLSAQDKLPYYEIPEASTEYNAGTVASRMVDGLGFRYFWATDSLRVEDLAYQPKGEGRSTEETVIHIYDLSTMLLKFTKTELQQVKKKEDMNFEEMRTQTLLNLQAVSNHVKATTDLNEFKVEKEGKVAVTFWNLINGPIADAIWHTGQVASYRRSSGNPINSKVNHFYGTVKK